MAKKPTMSCNGRVMAPATTARTGVRRDGHRVLDPVTNPGSEAPERDRGQEQERDRRVNPHERHDHSGQLPAGPRSP